MLKVKGEKIRMGKIDVKHTDLYYGDFHALKDINLEIPANKITAFIGRAAAENLHCSNP